MFKTTYIQNELKKQLSVRAERASEIQTKFDFVLPDYIIDEIIENENSKSFLNLHYLINCAVVNNRITENNAKLLKQIYSINV